MSTHNYKVLKNYPVQYIVKNPRHWWQTINTTYSEDTTVDVELRPFEGLEYTVNKPLIAFPRQTLLDGTILEEITQILKPANNWWLYGDGTNIATVVGSLTITDGVYSGFSSANYVKIPITFAPDTLPWEISTKVVTGSDTSTNTKIVHFCKGTGSSGRYGAGISVNEGVFTMFLSGGSSWFSDGSGTHSVQPNTTYWLRAKYDGSTYTLEYSTNGQDYITDISSVSTSTLVACPNCYLGIYSTSSFEGAWAGSIDLKETFVIVNGEYVYSYNNLKFYRGCLEGEDKNSEYNYTALVKDGEVLLVDTDQLRTGYTWANTVTIPGDDYFE